MSNIKISKKVITDLFKGKATYIKKDHQDYRLTFNQIIFGKDQIIFGNKRGSALATLELPKGINFNYGDTVTVNLEASMIVGIEDLGEA